MDADPVSWLAENKRYFSVEMNGYSGPPIEPYMSTLKLVDRSGKMLDLGMGNGMLLKFLMEFSGKELVPYGVEIKKAPLEQAANEILPGYRKNFKLCDVNEYDFNGGPFDLIIANPFYSHPKLEEFTSKCFMNLKTGGRIIYRIHDDVLKRYNIKSLAEVRDFDRFKMKYTAGKGIVFGIIDK